MREFIITDNQGISKAETMLCYSFSFSLKCRPYYNLINQVHFLTFQFHR